MTRRIDWTQLRGHRKDRIPDFAISGYGELPPYTSAHRTLYPTPDARDRTADLQKALDSGGITELANGIYHCDGSLVIKRSETVLRGQDQTVLEIRGAARTFIQIGLTTPERPKLHGRHKILDDYVPCGAPSFRVEKPKEVSVGSRIYVERRATAEWIKEMGMADLVRNGQAQTWIKPGSIIRQLRRIIDVQGDRVILDSTLVDSLLLKWAPEMVSYTPPPQTREVGIANLLIRAVPSHSGDSIAPRPSSLAVLANPWVERLWIRNTRIEGFLSAITLEAFTSQVTVQDCVFSRNLATNKTSGWPGDVQLKGTTALILRCRSEATVKGAYAFAVVTQTMTPGPNAVVDYTAPLGWMAPHMRYAMGVLFDRCDVDKVELANRGTGGSGHGWPCANAVAWNCRAASRLNVEKPPTAQNYAVGCSGPKRGNGAFVEYGNVVEPYSLFADQMERRFGTEYTSRILGPSYRWLSTVTTSGRRDEL